MKMRTKQITQKDGYYMTKAAELAKMGEVLTNGQIGGRRNLIINGAMNVAQRSASVTDSNAGRFVVNIANDMANTGYAISVCARIPSGNRGTAVEDNGVARAAGTTPVYILNTGSYYDSTDTQVIIHGDLA